VDIDIDLDKVETGDGDLQGRPERVEQQVPRNRIDGLMATANKKNVMYAGNLKTQRFTITQDGAALSLNGFTIKWALTTTSKKTGDYTTTPILEKKSTNVLQVAKTDAPNGICEVYLHASDTANLLGTYYYELELFDSNGEGIVVATGQIEILKNVVNT
jgi:hypothetical protein